MTYSNDPRPNPYAQIPSPFPNIDFPLPYWINKLADMIIVGCTDPDLAYGALLVPAALKMMWSVETPATKQIIQAATGRSWICGSKQIIGSVQGGDVIAQSDSGRFLYGLAKGLDIASYYAFMLSSGAEGVIDYASFAAKFQRVCTGSQHPYRGVTPVGGWPADIPDLQIGPAWNNGSGTLVGPTLWVDEGDIAVIVAWCSFTSLFGTGGVVVEMSIQDFDTKAIYDADIVNNLFSTSSYAVVRWFTTEGRALRDMQLNVMVRFVESVTSRAVPVAGGCYMRSWEPTASDAPPYWNVKSMLKQGK